MTYTLIGIYVFFVLASMLAMIQSNTWNDWIASFIAALLWPIIFTSRVIRTLNKLLS